LKPYDATPENNFLLRLLKVFLVLTPYEIGLKTQQYFLQPTLQLINTFQQIDSRVSLFFFLRHHPIQKWLPMMVLLR
jgi:hypothetical protein